MKHALTPFGAKHEVIMPQDRHGTKVIARHYHALMGNFVTSTVWSRGKSLLSHMQCMC